MKDGCDGQKPTKKRSVELPVLNNSGGSANGIRESRTSRWRAGALIALNLLMIAHIIQWKLMGETITPIEPSEAMFTLQNGAVNAGFIFFTLAILATLIFGRFVCGWGCHILALQDLCAWFLKKIGLKPKPFRSRLLVFIPLFFALYMFVWPTVSRLIAAPENQPFIPEFTNHLITTDFWATFPTVAVAIPFLFICGFMTVYFLGSKGFCTYGCPYGGFFSLADKVAPGKIRVTDACNQCGHCTATCTSNVLVHAEVKEYGMVVDQGCMKCMDCVSVCPNDALYFGFGKPAVNVPKTITKNYSISWREEVAGAIIFTASLLAVWNVYQLVPMLMAIGIAIITTFLALRTWQLFWAKDLAFYRFALKSSGKFKTAGLVFTGFAVLWIGLNVHSGVVHYHESEGAAAFESIKIPDELALAQVNPGQWLSPFDKQNISAGKEHFETASSIGLFTNADALPKLAWFYYLSGETDQAVQLLESAAQEQNEQGKAVSLYYRGAILNRAGSYADAIKSFDLALAERSDLVLAREEKGVALWKLGRKKEAVQSWNEGLEQNQQLVLSNILLSGAAAEEGKAEEAFTFERKAQQFTPADPLFNWVLGLRLKNAGMNELAEKHFARAIKMNPEFESYRKPVPQAEQK